MRILLDTQSWLWMVGPVDRLSRKARELVSDPGTELLFSAASAWELAIKYAIGKLELPADPEEVVPRWMTRSGVTALPVQVVHALRAAALPLHHGDPFDRLLIAQAQSEGVPVLTSDSVFDDYDVEVIPA